MKKGVLEDVIGGDSGGCDFEFIGLIEGRGEADQRRWVNGEEVF